MESSKDLRDSLTDLSSIREDDAAVWLTSYSDMVTLLLCFFILFFSIYSKRKIQEAAQTAVTDGKLKDSASTDSQTIELTSQQLNEKFAKLDKVYSVIHDIPDIETLKRKDHFLIVFNDGNFFDSGSPKLNLTGQYRMSLVLEKLLPYASKLFVEIQGHADSIPVGMHHKKYKNNLELSVLRAMSVYRLFALYGYPEEKLSVSGFSSHRPIYDELSEEEDLLARGRRVTFRVEGL